MSETIEQKMNTLLRSVEDFKKLNDERLTKLEKKSSDPLLNEQVEKANKEISKLQDELKALQTASNRTNKTEGKEDLDAAAIEHKQAMRDYFQHGDDGLTRELRKKFMSSDSDTNGGFLVTPEMSSEMVKKVFETSPIRGLASQQNISTSSLQIMEDLEEIESGWVGEVESRGETATPKLNMVEIAAHELFAQPLATQRLLDDAAVNVESWLLGKGAEKFSRDENTAFILGNGMKQPRGVLSYPAGTNFGQVEQYTSLNSGSIVADDILKLIYKLKPNYLAGAKMGMKRSTEEQLRLFKDTQNRYLWSPGMDGASNSSIAGYEIVQMNDIPAIAANALSIVFGDWKSYQIVDRLGIRVIRDIYTAKPFVKFYMTKRVGGGIKNFEGLKILKVKA